MATLLLFSFFLLYYHTLRANSTGDTIYGCSEVTDTGIIALAEQCPNLSRLSLPHCEKITDEGIRSITDRYPNLTIQR